MNLEGVFNQIKNSPDDFQQGTIVQTLDRLSRRPNTTVYVISQHGKKNIHNCLAQRAPKLGLAAENGFFYRLGSEDKTEEDWKNLLKESDFVWKD
jgi:trehalose-6-phosphatase